MKAPKEQHPVKYENTGEGQPTQLSEEGTVLN